MSNTKTVWLCNYNNYDVTKNYGIETTLSDTVDAIRIYKLEQKKKSGVRTEAENKEYLKINSEILVFKKNGIRVNISVKIICLKESLFILKEKCLNRMS